MDGRECGTCNTIPCKCPEFRSRVSDLPFEAAKRISGKCGHYVNELQTTAYTIEFKRYGLQPDGSIKEIENNGEFGRGLTSYNETFKVCPNCAASARDKVSNRDY